MESNTFDNWVKFPQLLHVAAGHLAGRYRPCHRPKMRLDAAKRDPGEDAFAVSGQDLAEQLFRADNNQRIELLDLRGSLYIRYDLSLPKLLDCTDGGKMERDFSGGDQSEYT